MSTSPYVRLPNSPPHRDTVLPTHFSAPYTPTVSRSSSSSSSEKSDPCLLRRPSMGQLLASTTRKRTRLPLVALVALGTVLFVVILFPPGKQATTPLAALRWQRATTLQVNARGRPIVDFESFPVEKEWACNPFKEPGRLLFDIAEPKANVWKPYDELCPPSQLLAEMPLGWSPQKGSGLLKNKNGTRGSQNATTENEQMAVRPGFEFLYNKTILLQGDSMERLHLTDFCNFLGGNLTNINPKHPASPPTYRRPMPTVLGDDRSETNKSIDAKKLQREAEDYWENRPQSWFFTRPWVCDLEEYNSTIINVFTWGMQDMGPVFLSEDFFHGPSTWIQRFHHITLPLLHNLAVFFDRPGILKPDFIELASGFWDLRGFTEQDFIAQNISRPYPTDSEIPFGPVGEERERKWAVQVSEALKTVAKTFPGRSGDVRDGPVISWRTLHHPKRNNYTPFSRAFSMDQLARKTLHDLRVSSLATYPSAYQSAKKSLILHTEKVFHTRQEKAVAPTAEGGDETDYGFDERIRVSEVGALLLGQENNFKDFLHPDVLPGSYLWSDMLLYELKRAVANVGRSGSQQA